MTTVTTVDAVGLRCPLPLLKLRQALKDLGSTEALHMLVDDPNAVTDIRRFCDKHGLRYEAILLHETNQEACSVTELRIQKA